MKDLWNNLVWAATIVAIVWLLAGCQVIKGAAGDLSWTFDKIDKAIVVPE